MRALRNIHTALRPGGLLLDIHPEPTHPWVEAQRGSHSEPLGRLDLSTRMESLRTARAAVQAVVDAGLFTREYDTSFVFTYHFASLGVWLDYMASEWTSAGIADELIERVREALLAGGGEIRIPREIHATRLRKRAALGGA